MDDVLMFPVAVAGAAVIYFIMVMGIVLTIVFFKIFFSGRSQKGGPQ